MMALDILYLLGDENKIRKIAKTNGIGLEGLPIFDPRSDAMEEKRNQYAEIFFRKEDAKVSTHMNQKKS